VKTIYILLLLGHQPVVVDNAVSEHDVALPDNVIIVAPPGLLALAEGGGEREIPDIVPAGAGQTHVYYILFWLCVVLVVSRLIYDREYIKEWILNKLKF